MSFFFVLLSAIALSSALAVVVMKNPIHSALCLIVNLVSVAGFFALLDAHFLALVQIIVYAGAIMVLVVFVIMLLNTKEEDRNPTGLWLFLSSSIFAILFVIHTSRVYLAEFGTTPPAGFGPEGTVETLGRVIFTQYIFSFEASSVLLMAAIVGAAMLAKTTRNSPSDRQRS